ncbi:hypothetical protein L1857_28010 [Amycolatopsis thermalba]|uniref:Uncharacterized protein n=1 Tax=Amycolatopsis thermalba TaxID=944492 RepID=A0ABY4P2C3_9PSEU|nr:MULTISPECIES: hypothetical protein [Amycolatopsis]UQS26386.1 hypothetical protein L1857_28010 [Amycolatopsis thermalba]
MAGVWSSSRVWWECSRTPGYAGQAHLARELAGVTPAVLVRERHGLAAPDPAAAVAVF